MFEQYFTLVHDGFKDAKTVMDDRMDDFVKTYSDIDNSEEQVLTKIPLDVGLFAALAFVPDGFSARTSRQHLYGQASQN